MRTTLNLVNFIILIFFMAIIGCGKQREIDSTSARLVIMNQDDQSRELQSASSTDAAVLSKNNSACRGKPIAPIMIIAGQSNAVGWGRISDLANDHWIWRFWKENGHHFHFWSMGKQTSWADGAVITQGLLKAGTFGPEMGIAAFAQASGLRDFYLYKMAVGGSTLANLQVETTSKKEWRQRGAGGIYDAAVNDLIKAAELICHSGLQPVVKAFFWMQGESDSLNKLIVDQYSDNLMVLITQARQDFMAPDTPVILGKIRNGPPALSPWTYADVVRAADDYVASIVPAVFTVETNDLSFYPAVCSASTGPYCTAHYDTLGQLALGERFFNAFNMAAKRTVD